MSDEAGPALDAEAFLANADGGKTVRDYAKGEVVFSQGDPAEAVFDIQQGQFSFRVVSGQGREAIVALIGAGSFFGEPCLAGQPLRTATAVTIEDCRIMRLDKATILRVIRDEPEFSEKFIAHLLERSIPVRTNLFDQLFNSSEKRLAHLRLPQRLRDGQRGARRHRFLDRLLQSTAPALGLRRQDTRRVYATAEMTEKLAA